MALWYQLSSEETIRKLSTSARTGLTEKEAKARLVKYGENRIARRKRINPLLLFLEQFKSFLVGLLLIAAGISIAMKYFIDAAVIIGIVIMNAIIGFIQEYRAERAVEALEALAAPQARALRDGKEIKIPSVQLVPGDIIILEQGDRVPADARLIEAINLKVDESALTGESVPVAKFIEKIKGRAILAERKNCIFMNTIVTNGRAIAVVTETGANTEVGKIARMIEEAEEKRTPLQKKLADVARTLGIATIVICGVIFALGIFRGIELFNMFLTSVSLAVAAVPEGLPAIITITLAIGLERMARHKAIIRRLPAVETLGSCNIICTDKTGTLTKNEMTVRELYVNNKTIKVTGEGYVPIGKFLLAEKEFDPKKDRHTHLLLHIGALCNGASLYEENKRWKIAGDPTEAALLVLAAKAGLFKDELLAAYPNISEFSFDAKRKRMSTIHKHEGKILAFVKGAPDLLLERCDYILKEGRIRKLTSKEKAQILAVADHMAERALRVLGMAYKEVQKKKKFELEEIESKLIFVGLTGMIDPPRPEARKALEKCRRAGIKVAVVTGDHKKTAEAIARELGLIGPNAIILSGSELDELPEDRFVEMVDKVAVYARVSPEHKLRIVKALQSKGYVVAMTGDGVNDAPALKQADIGVAMGLIGTDVAKEAADMILQDDNFATIVAAIQQGRGVFDNIKKSIAFLLSGNIGEVMIVFSAVLAGLPLPLLAVQILWINLVTDGLPALALSADTIGEHVMERKPRPLRESVFHGLRAYLVDYPIILFLGAMAIFWLTLKNQSVVYAQTAIFTTVVIFEMFQALSCHALDRPIFKAKPLVSRWLLTAIALTILLQFSIVYISPLQEIFHTTNLSLTDWAVIFGFSSLGFVYLELHKSFKKLISKV